MAITKQRKQELMQQYEQWLDRSKGLILAEYTGMTVKEVDALRLKMREVGAEFHIVKNTLGRKALAQAGMEFPAGHMDGSTAIVFAFQDPPAVAKAITEFARTSDFLKLKGGFLGKQAFNAEGVKSLADMPPLPVMRAQLLGLLQTPATRVASVVAGSVRQIVNVVKAYSETQPAGA